MIIEKELFYHGGNNDHPSHLREQGFVRNFKPISKPRLSNGQDQDCVPFNHKTCRWIISSLLTQNNVRRLVSSVNPVYLLTKCFQIPDSPESLTQQSSPNEKPAFSRHSDIFVTSIGITVYAKLNNSLEFLLNYLRRHVPHQELQSKICEVGFVRNVCKSTKDICVDGFNVATLAILRENIPGLLLLMEFGIYDPQQEFTLVQWNSHVETVSYYRDLLDYCVYQLRHLPCLPVTTILSQMVKFTSHHFGHNRCDTLVSKHCVGYDLTVFDVNSETKQNQSIFRRTLSVVFEDSYFANEVASSILSVLEMIQKTGFFAQCTSHRILTVQDLHNLKGHALPFFKTEKAIPSLTHHKLDFKKILTIDALQSVALLLTWHENMSRIHGERNGKTIRIAALTIRVLLDIGHMLTFFEKSAVELGEYFTKLFSQTISKHHFTKIVDTRTVSTFRLQLIDVANRDPQLLKRFKRQCNAYPEHLLVSRNKEQSCRNNNVLKLESAGFKGTYAQSNLAKPAVTSNNSNFTKKIFCHASRSVLPARSRYHSNRNSYFPQPPSRSLPMENELAISSPSKYGTVSHMGTESNTRRQLDSRIGDDGFHQEMIGAKESFVISAGFSAFIRENDDSQDLNRVVTGCGDTRWPSVPTFAGGDTLPDDGAAFHNDSDSISENSDRISSKHGLSIPNFIPRLELSSSSDEESIMGGSSNYIPTEISVRSRS